MTGRDPQHGTSGRDVRSGEETSRLWPDADLLERIEIAEHVDASPEVVDEDVFAAHVGPGGQRWRYEGDLIAELAGPVLLGQALVVGRECGAQLRFDSVPVRPIAELAQSTRRRHHLDKTLQSSHVSPSDDRPEQAAAHRRRGKGFHVTSREVIPRLRRSSQA